MARGGAADRAKGIAPGEDLPAVNGRANSILLAEYGGPGEGGRGDCIGVYGRSMGADVALGWELT